MMGRLASKIDKLLQLEAEHEMEVWAFFEEYQEFVKNARLLYDQKKYNEALNELEQNIPDDILYVWSPAQKLRAKLIYKMMDVSSLYPSVDEENTNQ